MGGVGRRYGQVLMDALEATDVEQAQADLRTFGSWLEVVPGLRVALENPGVPAGVKSALVQELGKKAGFAPVSLRFVQVVVANRRLDSWNDISVAFGGLCDEKLGVVRAHVATARPLDEAVQSDLAARLGEALSKPVRLEADVTPDLLGGMELRMGSTVYDGSIAGALRSLHRNLVKG